VTPHLHTHTQTHSYSLAWTTTSVKVTPHLHTHTDSLLQPGLDNHQCQSDSTPTHTQTDLSTGVSHCSSHSWNFSQKL